jgi:hypothetical protein
MSARCPQSKLETKRPLAAPVDARKSPPLWPPCTGQNPPLRWEELGSDGVTNGERQVEIAGRGAGVIEDGRAD